MEISFRGPTAPSWTRISRRSGWQDASKRWHSERLRTGIAWTSERWALEDDGKALVRSLKFKDFSEAFAFLTRVALHAEKVDHHPEFTNVWNRVDFRLTSHDAGGVTDRDIRFAQAINRLRQLPKVARIRHRLTEENRSAAPGMQFC